jgi:hypothetical protein
MIRSHKNAPLSAISLSAAALLLGIAITAHGQTINGSISGKVLDSSGGVIPKAKVTAKSLETGLTRDTDADDEGVYHLRALLVGRYSVTFSAAGFAQVVREPIDVLTAVELTVDATLSPGATQEMVSVTAEAPLIETAQSQVSKGANTVEIMELPGLNSLNGLAVLQAGAVNSQNGRPGSGFAVNGGRTRSNNFTIDGATNNDETLSQPRLNLAPEYIEEFRMITNNFSGEFGRNSSAVVSQITRSGTNDFHGTERWTWDGNGFNGMSSGQERTFNSWKSQGLSDYLALRKARGVVVDNLGVLSLGGPVKKNKSFFFVGYDRQWQRQSVVPITTAISPDSFATLQANASSFAPGTLNFIKQNFPLANDPTARGTVNIAIPGGATIPVAIQQYNAAIAGALSYAYNAFRWIVKDDLKLTDDNTLTFRYIIQDQADPGTPAAIAVNRVGQNLRDQSATINDTWALSATTVNEARVTYARRALHFPENQGQAISIGNLPAIGSSNYPQYRIANDWEYTDNVTLVHGRHTLKFGANLAHLNLYSFFPANLRGTISYNSLSDFLFDKNATFSKYTGVPDFNPLTYELGTFFQDDFRVSPNLTLNLGLRYEYDSAPLGYFSNAKPDLNNFGPRVGFAWRPGSQGALGRILGEGGKTSIRGGFSMTYDQIFQNVISNVFRNYPRGINYSYGPVSGQGLFLPANQPVVPTPEQYAAQGLNVDMLDYRNWSTNQRIAQPYTLQFSLGIERQIAHNYAVKVFYIGTRGIKLMREAETNYGFLASAVNANPATYASVINNLKLASSIPGVSGPAYRINPAIGGRVVGGGLAESTYHSLQTTLEKRFANGLQFQANYTWSSMIDDADDILGGAVNSTVPAVPFNFRLDKGRSGLDQIQRLVINYVYQIPIMKEQKGFLGRVIGGWEVAGITTEASGTPYTVFNANNALGTLNNGQLSTVVSNQRASVNQAGAPGTATSAGITTPYYIANPQNSGIIGNLGRNTLRTGGINNFDASLQKSIRVFRERHEVQFRWEVFDVFGHRNFTTIPANTVSNSTNLTTFLNLGQTSVNGRSMQFLLRYSF